MVLLDLLLAKFFDKINVSDQVSLLAGKSQNSKFESVKNLDDFLIHFIVMCKKAPCSKIKNNIFFMENKCTCDINIHHKKQGNKSNSFRFNTLRGLNYQKNI